MAEEFIKRKANSLFNAGIHAGVNLIQQVASFRGADSSDDERVDIQDAEDFITNGGRGILTFPVSSVRTGKAKVLHLHLYKAKLLQYHEGKKRVYPCSEILSMEKETTSQILLEMRQPIDLKIRTKRLQFESEAAADRFQQYVEFINEFGKTIKLAFNQIDYTRSGRVGHEDLANALRRVDLQVEAEAVGAMMDFGLGLSGQHQQGQDALDYCAFFHLFLNCFVSSPRDCLQEWLIMSTSSGVQGSSGSSKQSSSRVPTLGSLLPGEVAAFSPRDRVHWCLFIGKVGREPRFLPGQLLVTSYRLLLTCSRRPPSAQHQLLHSRYDAPAFFQQISVPLASIQRISVAPPRQSLYVHCKDQRIVRITLSLFEAAKHKVEALVHLLQSMAFGGGVPGLFAFRHLSSTPEGVHRSRGWAFADVRRDYERQDLTNCSDWQLFGNEDYGIDSYPRWLLLPRDMTAAQLAAAAGYRSRNRLPTIIYRHPAGGALLLRSAQPLAGLTAKTCDEELCLLEHYRMKGRLQLPESAAYAHSRLVILDCRGLLAATLNKAAGKGTESAAFYTNTDLVFGNIDNIHAMRTSCGVLAEALGAVSSAALGSDARDLLDASGGGYSAKLEESGWLRHLRAILCAAVFVAERMHFDADTVLVHCSDGWDRTPQVVSVAQLLLDPFYRTVPGLATLIEKDWCAFGHKFADRYGQGADAQSLPDERSPVFPQFLEVLFQLLLQFPRAFQFNAELLVFLADHCTSCLFGNFLGNSERERALLRVCGSTASIWDYVLDEQRLPVFLNASYAAYPHPLWPCTHMHRMRLMERYWLRWDASAHPSALQTDMPAWHDDWGAGLETLQQPQTQAPDNTSEGVQTKPPPPPPPAPPARTPEEAVPFSTSSSTSSAAPPVKPERRARPADPLAPSQSPTPTPTPTSSAERAATTTTSSFRPIAPRAAATGTSPLPLPHSRGGGGTATASSSSATSGVQAELQAILLRRRGMSSEEVDTGTGTAGSITLSGSSVASY